MKKLCFVSGDFRLGGSNVVAMNLANSLCDRYEICFVSIADTPENRWFFENRDERIGFHCLGVNETRVRDVRKKAHPAFRRFVRENKIDVVFGVGYYASYEIAPLPWEKKGTRYLFWEHGAPASRLFDKKGVLMRTLNGKLFDLTVALTKSSERTFCEKLHVSKKKATTVYNWIDPACFSDRSMYDLSSRRIVTVGRISEEKGFDMAVDIAEDLLSRCPDWSWDFIGDGPEREALERRVAEDGFSDRLRFLGAKADAWRYYGDYAILTLTSYREGLPLVLLEGMARGLPCVSFDVITGPSEIIRDGVNGYLVPCFDKRLFADRLETLALDAELRRSFSEKTGMDYDKFDKGRILARWVEIIEKGGGET